MHHKQNKQPPIELEDIRDYAEIVNHADRYKVETDKYGQEVLIAGKQNNGYAIVIETISTKKNELKLKTFYKENGKLEKNPIFRDSGLSSQLPKDSEGSLSPKPSANLDVPPQTAKADSTTTPLKIEANPAFGENFAEYAGKGAEAVKKLLEEKRGQVSGAFYRPDLGESGGYIDLVWGNYELKAAPGAKKPKSYGLSKILEKHAKDFESFKGADVGEKLANGLEYLIESGELRESPTKIKTIVVPTEQGEFRVGLSKGWMGEGENTWVITAYEYKNPPVETFGQSTSSKEVSKESRHGHLAQKDLVDSTTTPLKAQEDATPKSAEELIESLAVDNATAKKYNKHYPHDPRYILSDQHEAFKKLFGIKEGDDPFTPNMPKEVLEALQTAQEKPFKVRSKDFYFGLTDGYAPYFKQTLEHPDAVFQDEFFMYLVKNIDGKIFAFRAENGTDN
ncbi:hypothetical protein ASB7_15680 [Helicobacter ailurogastricus]|nr:hypothetical protein ASB7_15680 [Helicobacter ailurogastricus]